MRIPLALAVIATAVPAAAGPCRFHHDIGFLPDVLTPEDATLDQRGGVVVAAESVSLERAMSGDPTLQDYRFGGAGSHAVGKRTVIAPGLIVSAPAVTSGDLEFEEPDQTAILKLHYREAKQSAAIAAPKIDAVTYRNKHLGIMLRELTIAKLAAAPPAGVVALVVFAAGKPRSWARIDDSGTLEITIYAVDDCVEQIPDTVPTRGGDRVKLAWLDGTGHLSAQTSAIKVRAP